MHIWPSVFVLPSGGSVYTRRPAYRSNGSAPQAGGAPQFCPRSNSLRRAYSILEHMKTVVRVDMRASSSTNPRQFHLRPDERILTSPPEPR